MSIRMNRPAIACLLALALPAVAAAEYRTVELTVRGMD
jgi:hypothetical protein